MLVELALVGAMQDGGDMLFAITPGDVRAIMVARGGRMGTVEPTETGFLARLQFSNGLDGAFEGFHCQGAGEAMACPEYAIRTEFRLSSAAAAEVAVPRVRTVWLNAYASGPVVIAGRMGFTYGGVGREHLVQTFATYEQTAARGLTVLTE